MGNVILRWQLTWESEDTTWTPFDNFFEAIAWAKSTGVYVIDIIEDFPAE